MDTFLPTENFNISLGIFRIFSRIQKMNWMIRLNQTTVTLLQTYQLELKTLEKIILIILKLITLSYKQNNVALMIDVCFRIYFIQNYHKTF